MREKGRGSSYKLFFSPSLFYMALFADNLQECKRLPNIIRKERNIANSMVGTTFLCLDGFQLNTRLGRSGLRELRTLPSYPLGQCWQDTRIRRIWIHTDTGYVRIR